LLSFKRAYLPHSLSRLSEDSPPTREPTHYHKMHILVASSKQRVAVVIAGSATVWELKEKVEKQADIKAGDQELRLHGEVLADEMTLSEQGVQDRDRIELVVVKAGAAEAPPSAGVGTLVAKLQASERKLDELAAKVAASESVHQEFFTRILEEIDNLDLDGLTSAQRDEVRPMRKALVKRCDEESARALQLEKARAHASN